MSFYSKLANVIDSIKNDKQENEGLLDELKETFKKTDIGITIETFKEKGLGGTIASWISNDDNEPITKEQVMSIFGNDKIKHFSGKSGIPEDDVPDHISKILPVIIDKSTPDGKIED